MKATTYVLLLLLALTGHVRAQDLEIIALRNRTAEQVIPILQPLLTPGGVMTGQGYQLIVRTNPKNLADIRQVLASIDRPVRRLVISVRQNATAEEMRRGARVGGVISSSGDSRVDARVTDSRSANDERVDQRVQVLEGGRAVIHTGESRPLQQQNTVRTPDGRILRETTTTIQQASTGFAVVPRLSGDTVFLDIAPQREQFVGQQGAIQGGGVSSSVSGKLGEWIELGGVTSAAARDERGILSTRDVRYSGSTSTWVKVEELRN